MIRFVPVSQGPGRECWCWISDSLTEVQLIPFGLSSGFAAYRRRTHRSAFDTPLRGYSVRTVF